MGTNGHKSGWNAGADFQLRQQKAPPSGAFGVGGTGLEPVTPSLSIRGRRSRQFGGVRSGRMVERNPSRKRTLERTRANVERCHRCHAIRMFRRQEARPPETTPSNGEGIRAELRLAAVSGTLGRSANERGRAWALRNEAGSHCRRTASLGSICTLAIWLYDYRVWVVTGYREPYSFHGHRWFRYVETGRFLDQAWWSPYAALACFVTGSLLAAAISPYRPRIPARLFLSVLRSSRSPSPRQLFGSGDRSRNET